ncbi:MAG: hypothetical protein GC162_06500 [Planctomycetes bacterium]|nr:hypothetical protein [Planctomycetota bacterium]
MATRAAFEPPRSALRHRLPAAAAVGLFVLGLIVVSQGLDPLAARFAALLVVLIESALAVGAWLIMAAGWGWLVRRVITGARGESCGVGMVVQLAMGVAAVCMLDWIVGVMGALNTTSAYALAIPGWGAIVYQTLTAKRRRWNDPSTWPSWPWPTLTAAPAVALLLGAACIAPGWIWASEFGGYDVLSYHLQLPREWIANGAITGLTHNVYSYMPNLFEAAFMQLGLWYGSMQAASYAAQMLHAAMALLAAVAIGRIVAIYLSDRAGALAGAIYLAIPWTIVTGSMAYNEQTMMALGAAALLAVLRPGEAAPAMIDEIRRGIVVGFLCGAAILVKLTAAGFIAAPIALVLLMHMRGGTKPGLARCAAFIATIALVMTPWCIRNMIWTGNPVFPMLTQLFGIAHWTGEQAARWNAAHTPHVPLGEAIAAMGPEILGHKQFAFVIFPAALISGARTLRDAERRGVAISLLIMLAAQAAFWVLMTHHQSRFAIPMLLPAAMLIGLSLRGKTCTTLALVGVCGVTALSYALYLGERGGDAPAFIDGVEVHLTLEPQLPTAAINTLNLDMNLYAEGYATPFYITRPLTYHTVWDASPLGEALTAGGVHGARQWLLEHGYTHLLVDWGMIHIWTSEGNYGYDPNVSIESLKSLATVFPVVKDWGLITLYRVR